MPTVLMNLPYENISLLRHVSSGICQSITTMADKQSKFRQENVSGVTIKWSPKNTSRSKDGESPEKYVNVIPLPERDLRLVKILGRTDHILLIFENNDHGGFVTSSLWKAIGDNCFAFSYGLIFEDETVYLKLEDDSPIQGDRVKLFIEENSISSQKVIQDPKTSEEALARV